MNDLGIVTKIIKIDPALPGRSGIEAAADVIKKGGTVAFPTETVYGLGASALDEAAVSKVFAAKGRPSDNPLIVHISAIDELSRVAKRPPAKALALMEHFWPGPLTIILRRKKAIPDIVTGGLDTVAVRMPDHPVARALIRRSGVPLVAPSANLSGRPSPTRSRDVAADLNGRVDVIIEGGGTRIGIESTVIDMTETPPVILRPGGLPVDQIEAVIGPVARAGDLHRDEKAPVRSPGMKYRHYAPKARLIIIEPDGKKLEEAVKVYLKKGERVGVISFDRRLDVKGCIVRYAGSRPETVARRLFGILRDLDGYGVDVIISQSYAGSGLWDGIDDRLRRAAGEGY